MNVRKLLLLLMIASPCLAQTTTVTLQVTDASSQIWQNGSWTVVLVSKPGAVPFGPPFNLSGGGSVPNQTQSGSLDVTGSASMTLTQNGAIVPAQSQWRFTVCPAVTSPCFTQAFTIAGASQNVSPQPATIVVSCNALVTAYADSEVQCNAGGSYYNFIQQVTRLCTVGTGNICTTWTTVGSGGTVPGGSPIETQVNNSGAFGGTPCESFSNLSTGPVKIGCDWHPVGPNPYVDITQFGARPGNPGLAPFATGITATCTATQFTCSISSASTFLNGDGVVVYGAGAVQSMTTPSAPTVVPGLALNGTGTGITSTTTPTGSTTYNYKIVARDQNGGLTAASATGSVTTGAASLGEVTVNITSMSRSGVTVTVTTSSTHGFFVGCVLGTCGEVFISGGNGLTDPSFRGFHAVASAADSTHFTFTGVQSTANGSSTSATGGTASWYSCNHLTWSAVSGAIQYYVYSDRANPGTFVLVGRSAIQGTNTDLTFDDFGSPMMDNVTYPAYVPANPSASATNDNLSTTIASGAGTTTLTLANAVGTSVNGATIRVDAAPGIFAAAQAANGIAGGAVVIPASGANSFIVNSFLDLHGLAFSLSQNGSLYLNETMELGFPSAGFRWNGDINSSYGVSPADSPSSYPEVIVDRASPGVYFPGSFGLKVKGLSFVAQTNTLNGALLVLVEGGFRSYWEDLSFSTSTSSSDLMGIGLYARGSTGQSVTDSVIDKVLFSTGNTSDATSHNAGWFCKNCGQWQVRDAYSLHRGNIFSAVSAGGSLTVGQYHINGGGTPLFSVTGNTGITLGNSIVMDTIAMPCVAALSGGITVSGTCQPSSNVPPITGTLIGTSNVNLPTLPQPNVNSYSFGSALDKNNAFRSVFNLFGSELIDSGDSIFINGPTPAAPTCSVSAGGSLPTSTYTFKVAPVWQNSADGNLSTASASCTTTTGNQTITINWTTVAGNPFGYDLYYSNGGGYGASNVFTNPFSSSTTSFVWSSSSFNSSVAGLSPLGGPTALLPGDQGIQTDRMNINGNCSSSASPAVCGSSASGSAVIAVSATTVQVNTTAVTANSQILIQDDETLGTKLGVTCNAGLGAHTLTVTTRTPGTSFVVTSTLAPTVNPDCFSYLILN